MKVHINILGLISMIFAILSISLLGYSCISNTNHNTDSLHVNTSIIVNDTIISQNNTFQNLVTSYSEKLASLDSIDLIILKLIENSTEVEEKINSFKTQIISKKLKINSLNQVKSCDTSLISSDSCNILGNKLADNIKNLIKDTTIYHSNIDKYADTLKMIKETLSNEITKRNKYEKLPIKELKDLQNYALGLKGEIEVLFRDVKYNIFVADMDSTDISFHLINPQTQKNYFSINALLQSQSLKDKKTLMVTNAGMYMPDFQPEGLFIENYKLITPIDTTSPKIVANFYLMPNGVFLIDSLGVPSILETNAYVKKYGLLNTSNLKYATQSGPMLVINDSIHPKFIRGSKNFKIRSGVGIINGNKIIFVITLDEVNFYDFATFFNKIFLCKDALFLDGAISRMYLPVVNPNEKGGKFGPLISATKKNE